MHRFLIKLDKQPNGSDRDQNGAKDVDPPSSPKLAAVFHTQPTTPVKSAIGKVQSSPSSPIRCRYSLEQKLAVVKYAKMNGAPAAARKHDISVRNIYK